MGTRAQEFIAHYASPNYDPRKAHEYYERTKKLKGRKPAKRLLNSGRTRTSNRSIAKSALTPQQIEARRKSEIQKTTNQSVKSLERLTKRAEALQERIIAKLRDYQLELQMHLEEKTNKIPVGVSPKVRAFLERQNRNQAAMAKQRSSMATKEAKEKLTKASTDLKAAVEKARTDYAASIKAINDKYDKALKPDPDRIQTKVRKKAERKTSKW